MGSRVLESMLIRIDDFSTYTRSTLNNTLEGGSWLDSTKVKETVRFGPRVLCYIISLIFTSLCSFKSNLLHYTFQCMKGIVEELPNW